MSKLNRNMTKKTFTAASVAVFVLSFFTFNAYVLYDVKYSKLSQYKRLNEYHAKRVNSKIANSFGAISELSSFENQAENFSNKYIQKNQLPLNKSIIERQDENNSNEDQLIAINFDKLTPEIVEELMLPNLNENLIFTSSISSSEDYALESIPTVGKLNFYVGASFSGKIGLEDYTNSRFSQSYTTDVFKEHISSEVISEEKSMVLGYGGQAFTGVEFANGLSIESGVSIVKMKGSSVYSFEHKYIREIERLEWVVTGEDDAEEVLSKDYVETTAIDTVLSVFSRNITQVPLVINYTLDFGRIKPFASAGISASIVTSGHQTNSSSFQNKSNVTVESSAINQVNFNVGIGVDIEITKNILARVKPSFEMGLWNKNPEYLNGNLKDLSIQTGVYYKF